MRHSATLVHLDFILQCDNRERQHNGQIKIAERPRARLNGLIVEHKAKNVTLCAKQRAATHSGQRRIGACRLETCAQTRKRHKNHHGIRKNCGVRPQAGENEQYDADGVRYLPAAAEVEANHSVCFESEGGEESKG